ncbi:MAG TPA: glycosyltransferase [Promineifilum sp.]
MTYRRETYPVDILVRGYENAALTHACLSSIVANTDPALYQLTYVDNGTNEDSFMHLVRSFPGAQFARLPFNHGSVRAINTGLLLALQSPSDFVLLLDNDTEIPAGDVEWLDRFISYFEDSEVAAAGAVTDYVAGMQQAEHAPDTYTRDWEEDGRGGVKRPPDSPVLVSFALMLRKDVVQQIGLFDERYEPGNCEDYSYSIRLRQAGWRLVVAKSVWIKHVGSQTFGRMNHPGLLQTNYGKLVDEFGVDELTRMGLQIVEGAA